MPFELTINVSNLQESREFYARCGFRVQWIRDQVYMVRNERYAIYLNEADNFRPAVHYAKISNLRELHKELTRRGIAIDPPITNDDGHLEMVLIDPDCNEIVAWEDPSE